MSEPYFDEAKMDKYIHKYRDAMIDYVWLELAREDLNNIERSYISLNLLSNEAGRFLSLIDDADTRDMAIQEFILTIDFHIQNKEKK